MPRGTPGPGSIITESTHVACSAKYQLQIQVAYTLISNKLHPQDAVYPAVIVVVAVVVGKHVVNLRHCNFTFNPPPRRKRSVNIMQMGKDAAAAGGRAAKTAAETGTRAAIEAGKRATGKASDAMPGVKSYATWAGRKVVYVLFGTAFLYGLGSALPGAVAKYYGEGTGRRRESDDNKEEDQIVVAKYR